MSKRRKNIQRHDVAPSAPSQWARPTDISDLDIAFSARVSHLLPAYDSIPDDFKRSSNKYCEMTSRWFFSGVNASVFTAKPDIDKRAALSGE